uniref:Uncharacterized protein n=1 Tax=Equus caballus TaxID=9796 RepID=A0A9L0QWW1_HORSE
MEGNPPRQIFLTLKMMLSNKHSLFTNFPITCGNSDLPGNFSNQLMTGGPPPKMSMFEEKQVLSLYIFWSPWLLW